jgi:hypothetical protein
MSAWQAVTTAAELSAALHDGRKPSRFGAKFLGCRCSRLGRVCVSLVVLFGAKGICLTCDNEIEGVTIRCPDSEVAIISDSSVSGLGTLSLHDVQTAGQVLLLARDAVKSGTVRVAGLKVLSADLRGRVSCPRGFGVEAMQGPSRRGISRRTRRSASRPTYST